jgi:hypothetical protein
MHAARQHRDPGKPQVGDPVLVGGRQLHLLQRAPGGWLVGEHQEVLQRVGEVVVSDRDVRRWRWSGQRWEVPADSAHQLLAGLVYRSSRP